MIRRLTLVAGFLTAAGPALAANATGHAGVNVVQPAASIQVTQNLTFQNLVPSTPTANLIVSGGGAGAGPGAGAGAIGGGSVGGATSAAAATPATLSLGGQAGDVVSLSVPAALDLTRNGQPVAARVSIISTQGSAVLITGLNPQGALSVDVGGRVTLAGTVVEPGAYQGLLLVIAQYN